MSGAAPPAEADTQVPRTKPAAHEDRMHAAIARQALIDRDEIARLITQLPGSERDRVRDVPAVADRLSRSMLEVAAALGEIDRAADGRSSHALEQEIAEFYGKKHCMVFTTGYQANLGVISSLVGPDDFLLIDADSHASIYDACKMTQAEVVRFKHNDPSSLEARLRRLGDKPGNRLVVLEGIYSMLGDSAPLKEFIEVCKKYGASYDLARLKSDSVYNAALGAAELGGLLEDYRGSYIMTFAGYNAGRGSVKKWIERYGDPRDPKVDPIDWVERIPFAETRNYVQRVMENSQVYRVRFGGSSKLLIEADLRRGLLTN